MRLDVYVKGQCIGALDQTGVTSFSFAYLPDAKHAVSLTMPIRTASYEAPFLHPVFQVSLPEGDLRREIENTLIKRMDAFGDMAVLSVVGTSLVGRVQVVPQGSPSPTESQDEVDLLSTVLSHGASREMVAEFVARHAISSGVSGGYLKVLSKLMDSGQHAAASVGRWIVKFSDLEHPYLALNEYLSMSASSRADLHVPKMHLSDNGQVLLVERFDVAENGDKRGFEDICSLMALPSGQKFTGSAEGIIKTLKQFVAPEYVSSSLKMFFKQYACAVMMRNGDAHLKNFGILYSEPSDARLSPCYDMVTMSAYAHFMPSGKVDDMMALTLAGTKRWPGIKQMEMLATRCGLSQLDCKKILNEVAVAVNDTAKDVQEAINKHPDFYDVGNRMLNLWSDGISSLKMEVSFSCEPVQKKDNKSENLSDLELCPLCGQADCDGSCGGDIPK